MNADEDLCSSVLVIRKSFAGRKGFFFAKSSRSWRSSRLRGESCAGLSPRRREAREENAKDFSLVAAMPRCVDLWFHRGEKGTQGITGLGALRIVRSAS